MEAPIPASALIHSATLVSAGIYLMLVFSPIVQPLTHVLVFLGSLTAVYGALISSTQTDLKKILAFSTISHCGYLFFLAVSGNPLLLIAYFHFHGFFKAFSFLIVGFMLQKNTIYQDFRIFKTISYNSFEFFTLPPIVANLAGLPFFFGFFSKYLMLVVYDGFW
jgi:NADH:ubiquinone oxidoreductase subunit 5 (subunit L)/multisubunit Na+/H+ antiporter MnhA subunit